MCFVNNYHHYYHHDAGYLKSPAMCYSYKAQMNHSPDKLAQRSVCLPVLASVALGLSLFVANGFRISSSVVDFLPETAKSQLANSSPIESAVISLERQVRIQSKAPRRQPSFGALPPGSALDLSAVCIERSSGEARCQALTTRSQPNDRAPPLSA
jgi:hypothetical protein